MKRADILESIEDRHSDDQANALSDAINHWECKFNEIRDLLACVDIGSLDNIVDAHNVAESASNDLY